MTTPTYLSSTDLFNQVTFVPKGTAYDIFGGISQFDKIGFIVIPIGDEFYNWRTYFNAMSNPDWNRTMVVYDEYNIQTTVEDMQTWYDYLSLSGAQKKPYYWKKQFKRGFNKRNWGKIKVYIPQYGQKITIRHPVGRYKFTGPLGSAEQTVKLASQGDVPFNPYAPPPPGSTEVKASGDVPFNPYAPPPPG